MNTGDHPEALLDRALAGDLDKAERAELDDHLAVCAACALHVGFGTNVRASSAAARDEALNRVAIAGALARARAPRPRFRWRIGWAPMRFALASVLLVAGLAGAAVTLRAPRIARTTALSEAVATAPKAAGEARAASAPAAPSAPRAAAVDPPAPESAAVPPAEDRPSMREAPTAATLFARASDLRRQGRVERAIETYRLLQQRYPRTREASLSFALVGRLQLESGRPAQALVEFDRYLTSGTEIAAEEALAGRAEALRRLGRKREEADAWRALLARFPGSIYAGQAQARLAQ